MLVSTPVQVSTQASGMIVISAFDIRSASVLGRDTAIIVFSYQGAGTPTLEFFDRSTLSWQPVESGSRFPALFHIDMMAHTIEVVLDKTSSPTLASLNGTIFTISIPAPVLPVVVAQASGSPPAVVDPASLGFPELTLTFSAPQFTQLSSNLASLSGSGGGGGAEAANQVGIGAGSWSADIQQIILDALDATNNLLQELENQPGGWLPQIKDAPRGSMCLGTSSD